MNRYIEYIDTYIEIIDISFSLSAGLPTTTYAGNMWANSNARILGKCSGCNTVSTITSRKRLKYYERHCHQQSFHQSWTLEKILDWMLLTILTLMLNFRVVVISLFPLNCPLGVPFAKLPQLIPSCLMLLSRSIFPDRIQETIKWMLPTLIEPQPKLHCIYKKFYQC